MKQAVTAAPRVFEKTVPSIMLLVSIVVLREEWVRHGRPPDDIGVSIPAAIALSVLL